MRLLVSKLSRIQKFKAILSTRGITIQEVKKFHEQLARIIRFFIENLENDDIWTQISYLYHMRALGFSSPGDDDKNERIMIEIWVQMLLFSKFLMETRIIWA